MERSGFPAAAVATGRLVALNRELHAALSGLAGARREDPGLSIGEDLETGQRVFVSLRELRHRSLHVLGVPGMGKTWWLLHFVTQLLMRRIPVFALDLKGDLEEGLLQFAVANKLERRTVLVNAGDAQAGFRRAPALNGLDDPGPPAAVAGKMQATLKILYGQQHQRSPWLDETAALALGLLTRVRPQDGEPWSVFEAAQVGSLASATFRELLVEQCADPFLKQRFQELWKFKPSDLAAIWNPLANRLAQLRYAEGLAAILGQRRTSIDFPAMMRPASGALFLLRGYDPDVPQGDLDFLAAVALDRIKSAVFRRPKRHRAFPIYLVIDEAQRLCTGGYGLELADFLERARSYGCHVILSHQHLSQLLPPDNPHDTRLQDAIVEICKVRAYFAVGRRSAQVVWPEIFAGEIPAALKEVKNTIRQTKFWPKETTRTIRSSTHSESGSWGEAHGGAESFGSIQGASQHFGPDGLFGSGPQLGTGASSVSAWGSASSHGQFSGGGSADAESTATVPFLEPIPFQEVSSMEFVGLPEATERFIHRLTGQLPRQLVWKVGQEPAQALRSPDLRLPPVLERQVARFKAQVYAAIARPTDEVLAELQARVPKYLEAVCAAAPKDPPRAASGADEFRDRVVAVEPPEPKRREKQRPE